MLLAVEQGSRYTIKRKRKRKRKRGHFDHISQNWWKSSLFWPLLFHHLVEEKSCPWRWMGIVERIWHSIISPKRNSFPFSLTLRKKETSDVTRSRRLSTFPEISRSTDTSLDLYFISAHGTRVSINTNRQGTKLHRNQGRKDRYPLISVEACVPTLDPGCEKKHLNAYYYRLALD